MSETVADGIAGYVVGQRFAELPPAVIESAKAAILDTIAVALAASREPIGRKIIRYVQTATSGGPGLILGSTVQAPFEQAAMANGTLAHAMDFDDRGHASTHILGTAVALAGRAALSGEELIVAYVVGREVRMQLDELFDRGRFKGAGRGPGGHGWHATGTWGAFGSTATAAKLLQLDELETANAMGIAASLASGVIGNFGTMTKSMHAGNAARNGVLSALLASDGWDAERDIFSAERGITQAMTGGQGEWDVNALVHRLHDEFHITDSSWALRIKPYPSCTGSHAYIEAARALLDRRSIDISEVEEIVIPTSPSLNRHYPENALQTKFSGGFCVVATLITGTVSMETCTEEFLHRADVQRLMRVVKYVKGGDEKLVVRMRSGELFEEPFPPVRDLDTAEERMAKFFSLTEPILGTASSQDLADGVAKLEAVGDVRQLIDLTRAST
ncbi:MAG TPA: MmgE/PrpD family protein [Dermatophilaceae bacterium]|nr:MmgE/PrpD family protein [Dermatophilaceae bacterium]